jgi:hypothetical protein
MRRLKSFVRTQLDVMKEIPQAGVTDTLSWYPSTKQKPSLQILKNFSETSQPDTFRMPNVLFLRYILNVKVKTVSENCTIFSQTNMFNRTPLSFTKICIFNMLYVFPFQSACRTIWLRVLLARKLVISRTQSWGFNMYCQQYTVTAFIVPSCVWRMSDRGGKVGIPFPLGRTGIFFYVCRLWPTQSFKLNKSTLATKLYAIKT